MTDNYRIQYQKSEKHLDTVLKKKERKIKESR